MKSLRISWFCTWDQWRNWISFLQKSVKSAAIWDRSDRSLPSIIDPPEGLWIAWQDVTKSPFLCCKFFFDDLKKNHLGKESNEFFLGLSRMGCNQSAVKVQELTSKVRPLLNLPVEIETRWSSLSHRWSVPICLLYSCEWQTVYIYHIDIYFVRLYIISYLKVMLGISCDWPVISVIFHSSEWPPGHQAKYTKEEPHGLGSCYAVMVSQTKAGKKLLLMGFHGCWFVGVEDG